MSDIKLNQALAIAEAIKNASAYVVSPSNTEDTITVLADQVHHLRWRIDELMFEYCPDEMEPEQIKEYEKHQVAVTPREVGPNDKFTCPNCGGHYFNTSRTEGVPFKDRLGSCTSLTDDYNEGCGFQWERKNDYLYFTPGPTMKGMLC